MGIVLLAAFLIALGVVITSWPLAVAGIVLVVVGAAAGEILAMAGFGQTKPKRSPNSHSCSLMVQGAGSEHSSFADTLIQWPQSSTRSSTESGRTSQPG